MMDSLLTQLGVGGIFAFLIIRTVLEFISKRNGKNCPSNTDFVSRSEFEKHKDGVRYKDTCEQIVTRFEDRFDGISKQLDQIENKVDELRQK